MKILKSVVNCEITEINLDSIFKQIDLLLKNTKLDLIVGGPPCQAYSLVGRARDKNKMIGDKRNYLYLLYGEFLKRYQPQYFVFENVLGLLSARDQDGQLYFSKMCHFFQKCGYSVEYQTLNAMNYGVLQNRALLSLASEVNIKIFILI